VKQRLPLSEPAFLILLSISKGPIHGYGIIHDVLDITDGRVEISTGTLYGAISRMVDDGWIEEHGLENGEGSRGKKKYRLTNKGSKIVNQEINRLKSLIGVAEKRFAEGRHGP